MASSGFPTGANASSMRQSARQTRTNPSRQSKTAGRSSLVGNQASGPSSLGGGLAAGFSHQGNQMPAGIYPGITHFSDAIDALPREFRRHNSLLNEVDGKAWALEEQLSKLLTSATKLISVDYDAPRTRTVDVTPTRQVFQNIRSTLSDLLGTIDEKNHVARNANATLQRDVGRLDAIYPYVQREVSDEARLGSLTHWAYINKPTPKTSASAVNERPRRDTAGANSHRVSHGDADNEPRKEPVRRQRRTQAEIEADEARAGGPVRRGKPGPKSRVAENQPNEQALAAGAGPGAVTAGGSKRRKVEHTQTMTAAAMERSASTATNAPIGRAGSKESPAPDTAKKRTRAPNANAAARKRTNTVSSITGSPSLTGAMNASQLNHSSNSPVPNSSLRSQPRPQNQTQASSRQRPSSSASNRNPKKELLDARPPSAKSTASPRIDSLVTRSNGDTIRNSPKTAALELKHEEVNSMGPLAASNHVHDGKADYSNLPEINTGVSTKRSSKNSTPVSSTYTESQQRSRPSRTGDGPKRSHKKTGSISTARQMALSAAADEAADEPRGDDPTEPRYCYCNEVSFGEMVACDNPNCPREWFHLSCVGLTKPPSKSVVWYCNECKDGAKKAKSGNGNTLSYYAMFYHT
ncbi:PHD finger domain-containing protein [Microsporum canis CBS 113480]|uniref:Chromatin modification-related protein n=1 Tax=Arthroderma otae (strain ATCC MYA-4605 / CBS 113480) TaxID=554155 RepID=C5FUC7_ARTOC|nr:PHD finger domain-containing protein [Microsporum canis CBS 113480]EEQ33511.1 PHD finger domain-containing protein [Microsporum canis CBS 113480]